MIGVTWLSGSVSGLHSYMTSAHFAQYWLNPGRPVPSQLKIVDWDIKNQTNKQTLNTYH